MRYRNATFLFNLNKRRIFRKPTLNGLYTPFGSPVSGQKPSLPLKKGVLKSSRPSFLIKRAALGNLKASFHCTHWHRFLPLKKAPPFSPSLSSIVFTTPSVPLIGDRNGAQTASLYGWRTIRGLRQQQSCRFLCGDEPALLIH